MEITRKSFLSGAAAGLAGLTLLPTAAWAAPATETEGGILWLRNAAGQTFTARSAELTPRSWIRFRKTYRASSPTASHARRG